MPYHSWQFRLINGISYVLATATIVGCSWLSVKLYRDGKSFLQIASSVEPVASLVGVVIAILQIKSVKDITAATKGAAEEMKTRLIQNVSISELSQAIKLTQQIQSDLGHDKLEVAHTRLQDLRALLLHFESDRNLVNDGNRTDYISLLKDIGVHTTNVFDAAFGTKRIRVPGINKTLESVIEILVGFEHRLKFDGGRNGS